MGGWEELKEGHCSSKRGTVMTREWGKGLAGALFTLLACSQILAQGWKPEGQGDLPTLPAPQVLQGPSSPPTAPSKEAAAAMDSDAGESRGWLSGLSLEADYLFLRPYRQAMDYAIVNPNGGNVPDGTVINRSWDWRSAFRAGLGYRLPGGEWSLGFYYTYLHSDTSGSIGAPEGGVLFATLTHPGTVEQVQTASALTSLNYNVFDLELGRWWHPGPACAIRPFGGVRLAHIDQNFTALYDGGDANQDQVTQRLHFNGAGLRTGIDAYCPLWGGWGLFGRASGALLGGDFHATDVETNNAGATTLTNVSDYFRQVVPVAELAMGLAWQRENVRISAGYLFVNYFGLVNVPDFVDDAHQGKIGYRTGDLSLQGLVLRAEWCF
jgi:hypothetical protein